MWLEDLCTNTIFSVVLPKAVSVVSMYLLVGDKNMIKYIQRLERARMHF